jgi:phage tail-like protein
MSVNFPDLLYRYLPGLYRDKDEAGELRRFLEIMALPLAELQASIGQLHEDSFVQTCRDEFIPFIGGLIGIELDPAASARMQRAEVQEAFAFYRTKGLRDPLQRFAEHLTTWRVATVDFSQQVARAPFVEALNPVLARRGQRVTENPPASGNFFFHTDEAPRPLFDAVLGRPIFRADFAGHESEFAGVEGRFRIKERGQDIFTTGTPPPFSAVAADLNDFANPLTPGGAALVLQLNQVAVDPQLARFRFGGPAPLAGNLTLDFHTLAPASVSVQSFDLRDPSRMEQLGRSDDPAPYSLDLRAPRRPTDRIGRMHFDNHGLFFTLGHTVANQKPNVLPLGSQSGRFTFDNRPISGADPEGISLQLLDGIDGSPLTRRKLAGREKLFCGTLRGFAIRIRGTDITDLAFRPTVTVHAADLSDFAQPKDVNGAALAPAPTDVAVDPQLGRFLLDLTALGATAEELRVDYLLGPAVPFLARQPRGFSPAIPELFAFASDGAVLGLRDGFDGTLVSMKLRLGGTLLDFHGQERGWRIYRNGVEVSGTLPAEAKALEDPTTAVTPGRVALDVERGRFKFPAGFLNPGDVITVDFSAEDGVSEEQVLSSFAQRLPRSLPAGVVPVVVDTRRAKVDPRNLN